MKRTFLKLARLNGDRTFESFLTLRFFFVPVSVLQITAVSSAIQLNIRVIKIAQIPANSIQSCVIVCLVLSKVFAPVQSIEYEASVTATSKTDLAIFRFSMSGTSLVRLSNSCMVCWIKRKKAIIYTCELLPKKPLHDLYTQKNSVRLNFVPKTAPFILKVVSSSTYLQVKWGYILYMNLGMSVGSLSHRSPSSPT